MKLLEQIFSVTNKDKHKIITILGVKMKFTKENFSYRYRKFQKIKKKNGAGTATRYYLSKYLYVPELTKQELQNIPQEEINKPTDNIWTMWLQEDVPELIQMCLSTIKKQYPNAIVITESNMFNYINIPDYIYKKYKNGTIKPCHFSDYLRICLLDKYGGTWIDSTCYMLTKAPQYMTKENFFIMQDIYRKTISNFFIHSAKNNYLTKSMRIFLEEYWKKEDITIDYFFFHAFFLLLVSNDNTAKAVWENIPNGLNHITWQIQMQQGKKVNMDMLKYLLKTSFMYKLNRKNKTCINNPDSWYWFLINKYRHGELLTPDSVNKY